MKRRSPIHPTLDGLRPPRPPAELRDRVLASAAAALAARPPDDVWTRIWEHRGLRLAWAACLAALVAGHAVVSLETLRPATATQTAFEPLPPGDELQAVAALPPINDAALQRGYAAAASSRTARSGVPDAGITEDPS